MRTFWWWEDIDASYMKAKKPPRDRFSKASDMITVVKEEHWLGYEDFLAALLTTHIVASYMKAKSQPGTGLASPVTGYTRFSGSSPNNTSLHHT